MSYSRPHPQASKQFPGFGAIVLGFTIIPSIVVYNTMNTNTIIITTVINIDSNDINFILDDDFLLNLYMNFKYCIFNKTNLVKIMIKCLPFLERDHLSKCTLKMFFTRKWMIDKCGEFNNELRSLGVVLVGVCELWAGQSIENHIKAWVWFQTESENQKIFFQTANCFSTPTQPLFKQNLIILSNYFVKSLHPWEFIKGI